MHACLPHRFLESGSLSESERRALVEAARRLRTVTAQAEHALAGRHVAIAMSPRAELSESKVFEEAARGLGAHVSHISQEAFRPGHRPAWNGLLGRLYDAIDCEELSSAAAQDLEKATGVPVFNGVDDESHPMRSLLADLRDKDGSNGAADHTNLVTLVQAMLIEAMA